ncbi:MAG: chromosomal replication initiator protein DnaA [Candidatus Rokubacteria bacterium]|nr:chromosomal replication initiator protein DnaA [Candidatus Rokubacteria bacterium]
MHEPLWERILSALEGKVPAQALETWVRPGRLLSYRDNHLEIGVPNRFSRDWLREHHLPALRAAVRECLGAEPRITIVVDRAGEEVPPRPAGRPAEPAAPPLNTRYTFETFVVGSGNQFAQAACQAVADQPSKAYNPLFIYGGVGLGKTHLLHAIGHRVAGGNPRISVHYLSSERFTNDLINAIRYDKTTEFRARYRTIGVLLVDDIQFISGKERTQEEFFHTFNDLYESHKQIVISSDCSPKEIPEIEERLRSRFEWGLIADIQPPDFETRVAILKKKAALERVRLSDEVAYFIANKVKSNIRELEGSLTRMIAFCSLTGREMTLDLAQEVLSDIWGKGETIITIEQIQRRVAEAFGVKPVDLRSATRTRAVAFPRQIAMYLVRQLTHASLAEIGQNFGGKDHTTVLYAVEKIQGVLQEDPKFRRTVDQLIHSLRLE